MTGVSVGVAVCVGTADTTARREGVAAAPPANGGSPSKFVKTRSSERITSTTPAMVQIGTPPSRFSEASACG
jgi:hypothetical protein